MRRLRMIEILRKVYQKNHHKFVAACYRELLNRAPDPDGLDSYVRQLHAGTSKLNVLASLMRSEEAEQLYRSGPSSTSGKRRPSAADIFRDLYTRSPDKYVQGLYEELLGRKADSPGMKSFVKQLHGGAARSEIAVHLLRSGEGMELIQSKDGIKIVQKILFDFARREYMPNVE
ncbi:DUF4214 domain-containing protein [Paenibacillus oceani]|uniref:DUF4214 domain-containing protein n=1 Tax=Paenibacillus oceani TaxID=2772510 RepID=A0A927C6Y5_9BACL|nr:DUF4214 domain-containing protein [Paenibacillus oceani]MBD2860871.1 DUF4214 domain-containing protein [Paenibacillus oceani]